jgi:polyferredoxin
MNWVRARRITQVFFLLFFIILLIRARYPYEGGQASDLLLRFSPLVPLFDFIDTFKINWMFWPALIIIFLTPLFGRFFCGWICPLGTMIDASSKIVHAPSNHKAKKWHQKLTYIKYIILVASILVAFFSINIWGFFDPLSIINRAFTAFVYPLTTLAIEQSLLVLSKIGFLEESAYYLYDLFKQWIMPETQFYAHQVTWIALFFLAILGLEKISRRFWCRYLCPAGALLGFLSQFRFYERLVSDACPLCNKCQHECKMNAIPEDKVTSSSKVECIECFNCGALCPPKAKSITYRWRWKSYHSKVDYDRRKFLTTTGGSFLALGILSVGLSSRNERHYRIRPPGSLVENDFLERCIHCLACVRICQSNGRCLQPDRIHTSLLELWTPVALMRERYCEYNCNLCGEICPTDAILPLSVEDKQKLPIGLAYFNKNICIPFAKNKDCIVCEEHCPVPDKAIKFEEKEVTLPDGSQTKVKYPYVIRELCIGCGICETKCPLPGESGIFVTAENEQRLTKL